MALVLWCLTAAATVLVRFTIATRDDAGDYIVMLTPDAVQDQLTRLLSEHCHVKKQQELGFGRMSLLHVIGEGSVEGCLKRLSGVAVVEKNLEIELSGLGSRCVDVAAPGAWGLNRVDQRRRLVSEDPFDWSSTYRQNLHDTGAGVVVYVADTGIDETHPDFEGRVSWGFSVDSVQADEIGHGTHVAGVVGSRRYGVAKGAALVAVKVFSTRLRNTYANLIAGLRWIYEDHVRRRQLAGGKLPHSVVNLSLGGALHMCTDDAVKELIAAGITVIASAGNRNADACFVTPAHLPEVVTVAATDVRDYTADFTNWGECVDLFAPGVNITSTVPGGGSNVLSGTSASAPHVTGAIARRLGQENEALPPSELARWINYTATYDRIRYSNAQHAVGSQDRLLYSGCSLHTQGYTWPQT